MNKFADWMKLNDKKQRGVAQKIGISASSLHEILKKGQMPSLIVAYAIETYTKGVVTMYDWLDYDKKKQVNINENKQSTKKTKKTMK